MVTRIASSGTTTQIASSQYDSRSKEKRPLMTAATVSCDACETATAGARPHPSRPLPSMQLVRHGFSDERASFLTRRPAGQKFVVRRMHVAHMSAHCQIDGC